MKITIKKTI